MRLSRTFFRNIIFPDNPAHLLRNVLSLLSLLALFKYATEHTYTRTLELVIVNYDETVTKFLRPIQPLGLWLSEQLSVTMPWSVELQDHWRHIFVLMSVYFLSRVGSNLRAGLIKTGIFRLVWGLTIGFFTSILAGSFDVPQGRYWPNVAIALAAVGGMVLYELIINVWYASFFRKTQAKLHARKERSWTGEFFALSASDFIRAAAASLFVLLGTAAIFGFQKIVLAGLIMLGASMFLYGCFWLFWAWRQTIASEKETSEENQERVYWQNTDAVVGAAMVSIFIWATTAIVVDTGAKLIFF